MRFSVIVPTFKRRDEVEELLESLVKTDYSDFEVVLADGTPDDALVDVIKSFRDKLSINHLHRPMLGISESRNLGAKHAIGEYFLFFDSDCIIPTGYFSALNSFIDKENPDAFGGPDAAAGSFTPVQKAINHTMTSFLTTGGIRGKKSQLGQFHPRGFNMGVSRKAFEAVNGYALLKVSEDIDLSIRLCRAGYKVSLIPDAIVFHKRRTNFKQFFRQVFRFGAGRINIGKLYKGELKLTHTIPALFLFYVVACFLALFVSKELSIIMFSCLAIYLLAIFFESLLITKSLKIGVLSLFSVLVQFAGYGSGFIVNYLNVIILRKKPIVF